MRALGGERTGECCGSLALRLLFAANRLLRTTDSTEALLKLVDASLGVDELLLAREERMRICGDTNRNHEVVDAIHALGLSGLGGGASDELLPGTHVLEDDRIVFGVEILFHGNTYFRAGGENA